MANDKATPNKPVATFRSHGISTKVFQNYAKDDKQRARPFYKVQTVRTYKDGDGFKSVAVFSRDDLMIANELNLRAWRRILELEDQARKDRFEEAEER